jgi:regulator of replication initiation timing
MKSISRFSAKTDDKFELLQLQKENAALRLQLKELGNRLNTLIELRESKKTNQSSKSLNPNEELKEYKKMIEIYK